jgi:hypothetical protein
MGIRARMELALKVAIFKPPEEDLNLGRAAAFGALGESAFFGLAFFGIRFLLVYIS